MDYWDVNSLWLKWHAAHLYLFHSIRQEIRMKQRRGVTALNFFNLNEGIMLVATGIIARAVQFCTQLIILRKEFQNFKFKNRNVLLIFLKILWLKVLILSLQPQNFILKFKSLAFDTINANVIKISSFTFLTSLKLNRKRNFIVGICLSENIKFHFWNIKLEDW